jgi:hypothetical protein
MAAESLARIRPPCRGTRNHRARLRAQPQVRQLQHQPKSLSLERCAPGNQHGLQGKVGPAKFFQPTQSRPKLDFIRRYKQGSRVVIGSLQLILNM